MNPWFLILCEVTWMIYDSVFFCDGCSWVPCLFWTVELSTVLQTNPPRSVDSSVFQHLLHIWTLSSSDCITLRSIFSHWGQLRDSNTTIKKGSNIHWCSRRKHNALRAGGWEQNEEWNWTKFSYFKFKKFSPPRHHLNPASSSTVCIYTHTYTYREKSWPNG